MLVATLELEEVCLTGPAAHLFVSAGDVALRRHLVTGLDRQGYEVLPREDELLARLEAPWLRDEAPDVVVSELRGPGRSDLDALAWLGEAPSVPVVLVAPFGARGLHARPRLLGSVTAAEGPFDLAELLVAVARAVERRLS